MIPFSPSFYPLLIAFIVLFGSPFVLGWLIWLIRLKTSPTVRQNLGSKHTLMILLSVISLLWLLGVVESYRMNKIAQRVRDEIDTEEQIRTPTLTQETTLAGITMPAGTKLELLHKNAVGEEWVKPDYFEYATFPTPILWQGVPITQMRRFLATKQDNDFANCTQKHPENFDQCFDLSSHETTRILWGGVSAAVAGNVKIGKLDCQNEIFWHLATDETGNIPAIDASDPVPKFQISNECHSLAKGNTVSSENGFLTLTLPENGSVSMTRMLGDDPSEFFMVQSDEGIFEYDLFTIQKGFDYTPHLHLDDYHLRYFVGKVIKGTPECPLSPNSSVEWSYQQADTLLIYTDKPIKKCGKFRLVYLNKTPDDAL